MAQNLFDGRGTVSQGKILQRQPRMRTRLPLQKKEGTKRQILLGGYTVTAQEILNSPAMWIVCSVMMVMLLAMVIVFLRMSLKTAKDLNVSNVRAGIRAAAVTAVGPSLSNVLIILSLVAMVGAPNTWMRVNDVGAPRTELGMAAVYVQQVGQSLGDGTLDVSGISYLLWGMSFSVVGWMIVTLILTPNMGKAIDVLNKKFNPLLIRTILGTSTFGVFCYLLSSNIIGQTSYYYALAAAVGCISILIITKFFKKNKTVMQLSLGIAIVIGVAVTAIAQNILA